MKTEIHPKYFTDAKVQCVCGNHFTTGATVPEIKVEVCAMCHPFYTGRQNFLDTTGRLERFKQKMAAAEKLAASNADKPAKVRKSNKTESEPVAEVAA